MKQQSTKKKEVTAKRKSTALVPTRREDVGRVAAGKLYNEVRTILDEVRGRAARMVYVEMVRAYWLVGKTTIRILLCAEKNNAVVRYTLPEGERQIFASRYQLYLPSEDELAAELNRERDASVKR